MRFNSLVLSIGTIGSLFLVGTAILRMLQEGLLFSLLFGLAVWVAALLTLAGGLVAASWLKYSRFRPKSRREVLAFPLDSPDATRVAFRRAA